MGARATGLSLVTTVLSGFVSGMALLALTAAPAAAREAGVAAAVNADSLTKPPTEEQRTLVVGHNVVFDEKISTGPQGQAQLLMLDQSAVTVAPNSELVIDKFVYDPDKRTGEMAMTVSKGLMRFVGGRLSKSGGVQVNTPVATMGIRGGIAFVDVVSPTVVDVTLLYGDAIEGATTDGAPFTLRRSGYFTRLERGQPPTVPRPATNLSLSLAKLQGRENADGGADEKPTDEGAESAIGDGALAAEAASRLGIDIAAIQDVAGELQQIQQDDEIDAGDLFEFVQSALDTAVAKRGQNAAPVPALIFDVVDTVPENGVGASAPAGVNAVDGLDPNAFDAGDRLFLLGSVEGGLLVSVGNRGPLAFFEPGVDDPDNVRNVFDATDDNVYVSPATYNAAVAANAGSAAAGVFAANNDFGGDFFNYDLSTFDFDGVNGSRLTVFGGRAVTTAPTGRTFFEANGDSQTISLLPFSEIGRAQLPAGGGFAGVEPIQAGNVTQTPVMVDWDKGKLLYLGGVFQNVNPGDEGSVAYGIQAVVGDVTTTEGGQVLVNVINAGSSHFQTALGETRAFHAGLGTGTPLGDPAGLLAISLDGDHTTIEHLDQNDMRPDPVTVSNHQFGVQTGAPALGATGSGVTTETLFAATLLADADDDIVSVATNPDVGGAGTLTIDRDAMTVVATFVAENSSGGVETLANVASESAFFDDNTFGIASINGLVAVSGEAVGAPDPCACAFMHWGLWAVGSEEVGEIANSVSDIGAFFAGAPTIDMPITGTATFSGAAYASMITPNADSPAFASGRFDLSTNFAAGVSSGQINLANSFDDRTFNMIGRHAVGDAALSVDYIAGGRIVGDGHGAFFGPGAQNVGVTINIDDGAGTQAAGAAVGQRQ